MRKHISDALVGFNGTKKSSPASNDLFNIGIEQDAVASKDDLSIDFHSLVAKLMYIAKRTRPDILTAISYLATRVQSPIGRDRTKLRRVLSYLSDTQERSLTLRCGPDVQLAAYVDASYNVHPDCRSHGGIILTLGSGAVYAKSFKLKLVTKSSTEAELVAMAEALEIIAWSRHFLEAIGYHQKPTKVYQDNKSTMLIASRGPSSAGKSKHIKLRYFGVKAMIDNFEVMLQYLPTEDMIADVLTKPLQGALFAKLSALMHGE